MKKIITFIFCFSLKVAILAAVSCYPTSESYDEWLCSGYGGIGGDIVVITNTVFGSCTNCVALSPQEIRDFISDFDTLIDGIPIVELLANIDNFARDYQSMIDNWFGYGGGINILDDISVCSVQCSVSPHGSSFTWSGMGISGSGNTAAFRSNCIDKLVSRLNNGLTEVSPFYFSYVSGSFSEILSQTTTYVYDYRNLCSILNEHYNILNNFAESFATYNNNITNDIYRAKSSAVAVSNQVTNLRLMTSRLTDEVCSPQGIPNYPPSYGENNGLSVEMVEAITNELVRIRRNTDLIVSDFRSYALFVTNTMFGTFRAQMDFVTNIMYSALYEGERVNFVTTSGDTMSWTNAYINGYADTYDYQSSNVLSRLELLLWSLTELNTGESYQLTNEVDEVQAESDFQSSTNEMQSVSQEIPTILEGLSQCADKFRRICRALNFRPNSSDNVMIPSFSDESGNLVVPAISVPAELFETSSNTQMLKDSILAFYWVLSMLIIVFFWRSFGGFVSKAFHRVVSYIGSLLGK